MHHVRSAQFNITHVAIPPPYRRIAKSAHCPTVAAERCITPLCPSETQLCDDQRRCSRFQRGREWSDRHPEIGGPCHSWSSQDSRLLTVLVTTSNMYSLCLFNGCTHVRTCTKFRSKHTVECRTEHEVHIVQDDSYDC